MPCGCKKDMSNVEGFFKMRFIGKPNGKLMKGAPGNYKQGEISSQPYKLSRFPYWELVDEPPKLLIPLPTESDSVFDEAIYIPNEDIAPIEMNTKVKEVGGVNVDPDAPAILEPYMRLNLRTGKMTEIPDEPKLEPKPELVEPLPEQRELKRDDLMKILTEAGVEYSNKARTATLKKMVDELAPKE